MRNFKQLVGHQVLIATVHDKKLQDVTIAAVDDGGIWFTSESYKNTIMNAFKVAELVKEPVFFLPYCQMFFAVRTVEHTEPSVTAV
jgi:hypothetical protein